MIRNLWFRQCGNTVRVALCVAAWNLLAMGALRAQSAAIATGTPISSRTVASSFVAAPSVPLSYAPTSVASGYLTSSGYADVVVANASSGTISVFRGAGRGTFAAAVTYSAGAQPSAVAIADINGDGNADVIVANESEARISVLLGHGDGTLAPRLTFDAGLNPSFLVTGDFSGNGKQDIAVAGRNGSALAVFQNQGGGNLSRPFLSALSGQPVGVAVADVNNDGHPDLAIANANGKVSVLLGKGNAQFSARPDVDAGSGALSSLAIGDFNRDGNPDVAVTSTTKNEVDVLLGKGDGTFDVSSSAPVGASPIATRVADVDADGIPDLVVINQGSNTFSVLRGNGDGTFKPALNFVVGNTPLSGVLAELYGNGHIDVATIDNSSLTLSVPSGNGDGTFSASQAYVAGAQPVSVAAGDLDGNGEPDLVTANYCGADASCGGAGGVAVLLASPDGGYQLASTYTMGGGSISVALLDVNGDKKLDLVALNRMDKTVSVRLGAGDGTFGGLITIALATSPVAVAGADFNRDGKLDLAVIGDCGNGTCSQPGQVEVLLGAGDGGFAAGPSYAVGFSPVALALGATRTGGNTDIVVANRCGQDGSCHAGGTASLLLGNGVGVFAPGTEIALGNSPSSIALADLRGKGVLDLVVSRSADNTVAILPGTGDGTFRAAAPYAVGSAPGALVSADFNGDGKQDIAVLSKATSAITVLYGNGDGSVRVGGSVPVSTGPTALAAISGMNSKAASLATVNGGMASANSRSNLTVVSNLKLRPMLGAGGGTTANTTTLAVTPTTTPTVNPGTTLILSVTVHGTTQDPTGTVDITSNGTPATVCSGLTLSSGAGHTATASCTTSSLQVNVTTLTATYGGDGFYDTSSGNASVTVSALTPSITVTPSPSNSTTVNDSVILTAQLAGAVFAPVAPSGNFAFQANGVDISGCTAKAVDATGKATCTTQALPAGTYAITAAYSGDANFVPAAAGPETQTVAKLALTSAITPTPSASTTVNDSVTLTAQLSGGSFGTIAPNGSFAFKANGVSISGCTAKAADSTGKATCTTQALVAGTYGITADYSGDSNYTAPQATETQTVAKLALTSAIAPRPSASTTVNDSVTLTAQLSGGSFGTIAPNGSFAFKANGVSISGCTAKAADSTGKATCTTQALVAGTYGITADYSGDSNYTAPQATETQTVAKLALTSAITPTPSASTTVNDSVTLTAQLSGGSFGTIAPNGNFAFKANGVSISGCTAKAADSTGKATCTTQALVAGTYGITADYSGDSNYTAPQATETQTVAKLALTSAITPTPSAPTTVNDSVTLTAQLSGGSFGTIAPNGSFAFKANGVDISGCTAKAADSTGRAICTTQALVAGTYAVTATYSGDSNYTAPVASETQTVAKLALTASLVPTPSNSTKINDSVTLTAQLSGGSFGIIAPNGNFAFAANGTAIAGCTAKAVDSTGKATCTTQDLPLGESGYAVTATYGGDSNYTAPVASETQTVTHLTPTLTITASPGSSVTTGTSVTFTATLSGVAFSPFAPNGTVAFTLNGVTVGACSAIAVSSQAASCTLQSLLVPADTITATYSGDPSFVVASAATFTETVTKAAPTVTLGQSPSPASVNQTVTFTATVPSPAGGTPSVFPTGSVTFTQGATTLCSGPVVLGSTYPPTATCSHAFTSAVASPGVSITATYSGDSNFTAGTAGAASEVVNAASTTTAVSSSGSSAINQPVTFSAGVTPAFTLSGGAIPQGSVVYSDTTSNPAVVLCTKTVASDGAVPACAFTFAAAGSRTITAAFTPSDANFVASTSTAITQVVNAGSTGLNVVSSVTPSSVNQQVTFTASFSTTITGTQPQGSITYSDGAKTLCTGTLTGGVIPTCQAAFTTAGAHSVSAVFTPSDTNFSAASSNPITQTVSQAATTTSLNSSNLNSSVNQSVTFTATVTPATAGVAVPTGTVTFSASLGAQNLVLCGTAQNVSTASAVTTATCTASLPSNGSWSISATYNADTNFTASASTALSQSVGKTGVNLTGIPATDVSEINATYTLTATIAASITGTTIPTGTVTFTDGTATLCGGPVAVAASGNSGAVTASCAETFAAAGTHNISVVYSGDANFGGTATAAAVAVAASPTGLALASSMPSSIATQGVTFTAVVTPSKKGVTAPTGTVAFSSADGTLNAFCGSVTVVPQGDGTSLATCAAAFPHNNALPGHIVASAIYNPDSNTSGVANFVGSSGTAFQIVQDFGIGVSVTPTPVTNGTNHSSLKGIYITQGYANVTDSSTTPVTLADPFNPATVAVAVTPSGSFNDQLNVSCAMVSSATSAIVSDPGCKLSTTTLLGANGGSTLNVTVSASGRAPIGSYAAILTFADATLSTFSQTSIPLAVNVIVPSSSVTLGTSATASVGANFVLLAPITGTVNVSCPQIWDTVNQKMKSNATGSLLACATSGSVSTNGSVATIPITISTGTTAMLASRSRSLYLAGVLGLPLLALVTWFGGGKARRRSLFRMFAVVLLALGISLATGCGGSFTRPQPLQGTGLGSGSYVVQVVATDSAGQNLYAEVPLLVSGQ